MGSDMCSCVANQALTFFLGIRVCGGGVDGEVDAQ